MRRTLCALCCLVLTFGVLVFGHGQARAQWDDPSLGQPTNDETLAKKLELKDAPKNLVFLRAMPDKPTAVVGEQITLNVYLYYKVAYEMVERHEPPYTDFLRYPLLNDPSATRAVYTNVNGERYGARLVEQVALVPLKAGKLHTGTMRATFVGSDFMGRMQRESNDVEIEITEPPADGRPQNFLSGTVGTFTLSATVTPRSTKQGGSVGVIVRIEGQGNLPSRITTPSAPGATWLDPNRKDTSAIRGGKVGGVRTFEYVVRLENAGQIDLGTLELPYFDPQTKKYEVAKVELGKVEVEEVAPTDGDVSRTKRKPGETAEPLSQLPKLRTEFPSRYVPPPKARMPLPWFAIGLGLPPLAAILFIVFARARVVVKERRAAPSAVLRKARDSAARDAKLADRTGDPRALGAALEKMLHGAIEARTGIKSRAYQKDDISRALAEVGVERDAVDEVRSVLDELELVRFAPSSDSAAQAELSKRVKTAIRRIEA
ncbi:MAG: hypothetical protein U0271_08800 [Polyangiaceae bacterium]